MCANCFTAYESMALNAAGLAGVAAEVGRRVRRRPAARRRAGYEEAADFLRSLGHEPSALLGPAPTWPRATAVCTGGEPMGEASIRAQRRRSATSVGGDRGS